jgi:uncharacterized protein (DUF433 family)
MVVGVPVITGTRVPLWNLIEYLEDGRGLEVFLADHPQVTPAQAYRAIVLGLHALIERREELGRGKAGGQTSPHSAQERDSGEE